MPSAGYQFLNSPQTVPGSGQYPFNAFASGAQNSTALQALLPQFQQTINAGQTQAAQGAYQTAAQTSPEYNQLMLKLYQQYGPQLAQLGNQISGINMGGQVSNEANILGNQGTDLLNKDYQASQIFDAPYYQTRDAAATQAQNLLTGSSDISGNLTGSEQNQIAQGLAREGSQRGTYNAPSNTETVANAMTYGNAAFQRQQQEKSTLSTALNSASQFLPASKSGVNPLTDATGQNAQPNFGLAQFQGVNQNTGNQVGSQVLGGMQGINNIDLGSMYQEAQGNAGIQANAKDWSDYLNQVSSSVSNIASAAGAVACWVAREVFGEDNPKWQVFRSWLFLCAPKWFLNLYLTYGERFAKWIHNKPILKHVIRMWMETRINSFKSMLLTN